MHDELIDEVVGEFLVESYEALDQLDRDLLALEGNATPETLASIFRTMPSACARTATSSSATPRPR